MWMLFYTWSCINLIFLYFIIVFISLTYRRLIYQFLAYHWISLWLQFRSFRISALTWESLLLYFLKHLRRNIFLCLCLVFISCVSLMSCTSAGFLRGRHKMRVTCWTHGYQGCGYLSNRKLIKALGTSTPTPGTFEFQVL